jgi:5-(carboxyamino)imidazole ribonucleotide mutase
MPRGVPVATVAINGAANAALLAARILGTSDPELNQRLSEYRDEIAADAAEQDRTLPRK